MSLKSKLILILLSVFVLYGLTSVLVEYRIIHQRHQQLEDQEGISDLIRVTGAIQNEIHHLSLFVNDWAAWDDTYEFIQNVSTEYIESNLVISTFTDNKIDLIHFYDTAGRKVWGQTVDLETEDVFELAEFPNGPLPKDHPLFSYDLDNVPLSKADVSGIFFTERGPMIIASRLILTSQSEGPAHGSLVMGKFLSEDVVASLSEQTRVDFEIKQILSSSSQISLHQTNKSSHGGLDYRIVTRESDFLHLEVSLPDIQGNPALLVKATVERKITAQGKKTIKYAIFSLILLIILAVGIVGFLIDKFVVGPITYLSDHVTEVTLSGDLSSRALLNSNDEIGALGNGFDTMLEELQESRKRLLEMSFRSGMSEMAAGVLHNIKNSLTVIIGKLDFLRNDVIKTPAAAIERARYELEELENQGDDQARKAELLSFINLANRDLLAQNAEVRKSIEEVHHLASQIENILIDHERWAVTEKVLERIKLASLISDSVEIMKKSLLDAATIIVDPGVDDIGKVTAHQFTLLQVLVNVLSNGAEAIISQGNKDGKIYVSATFESSDTAGMLVHMQVSDNGAGISPEALNRIFERGYSTKEDKFSGIGLHWCANAMNAQGGRMYAESEGIGQGSTVHIIFPAG